MRSSRAWIPREIPSLRSPLKVAARCAVTSRGSTYASTRWAPSSMAEATVSRTASMVVSAVHEMRTTPSPTDVLSVSLIRSSLGGGSQPDRAERWEGERRRCRLAVPAVVGGGDGPEVADAGAGIGVGVGVEHLGPVAARRQPDPVVAVRDRGEVRDAHDRIGARCGADEGEYVALGVVGVQPLEA